MLKPLATVMRTDHVASGEGHAPQRIRCPRRVRANPFLDEALEIGRGRIVTISNDIADLRGLITSIAVADLLITPSTGPEHIADALNLKR